VEPCDVRGVDHPAALRAASQRLHTCRRASHKAACGLPPRRRA
jgi:hypothetical protein